MSLSDLASRVRATGLPRRLFELARDEDLGWTGGSGCVAPVFRGDVTSLVCIDEKERASARVVARQAGIISGLAWIPDLVEAFGARVVWEASACDGQSVLAWASLGTLAGNRRDLLALERTVLNLVGRCSGIATRTGEFVARARRGNPSVRVLDTRKTTLGLRMLEKYAVRCGGGHGHRLGLFDAVLVKDNHLAGLRNEAAIRGWITHIHTRLGRLKEPPDFVEVEVDTLEQLRVLLEAETKVASIVLLDNMMPAELERAVAMNAAAGRKFQLEASGGVRLETIERIAATGVDRISVGSMTHGAVSLDVALDSE